MKPTEPIPHLLHDNQNFTKNLESISAQDLVSYRDPDGNTALMLFCKNHNFQRDRVNALEALLAKLGDAATPEFINHQNKKGETALMHLFPYNLLSEELIKPLIEKGADLKLRNNRGQSAVMILRSIDKPKWAEHLISLGAPDEDNDYIKDWKDYRNIHDGRCGWRDFIEGINQSVSNSRKDEPDFPFVRLNADNSVTFYISNDNKEFLSAINQPHIQKQLEAPGRKLLDVQRRKNSTEYHFNITAEDLHEILMSNTTYAGYNKHNGLLSLYKLPDTRDDTIMLFPVFMIDETTAIPRIGGCQLTEIPTLQLTYLIKDEEAQEKIKSGNLSYHHAPAEFKEAYGIDGQEVLNIIEQIFAENGITISGSFNHQQVADTTLTIPQSTENRAVKLVAMDDAAKAFYVRHGSTTKDELGECKSLEIDKETFLEKIKLRQKKNPPKKEEEVVVKPSRNILARSTECLLNLFRGRHF